MLTAKADEVDRVVGLEVGADDYLIKPFSPRELVARVRALLRRPRAQVVVARVLRFGDLTIDVDGHEVRVGNEVITLTATEYRLIALLASTPGRMYSRAQLLEHVWGSTYYGDDRVVNVHIANARRKIQENSTQSTVYRNGTRSRVSLAAIMNTLRMQLLWAHLIVIVVTMVVFMATVYLVTPRIRDHLVRQEQSTQPTPTSRPGNGRPLPPPNCCHNECMMRQFGRQL
jgi:DNA-binding winged helix-turn-helix (wHTH) protein